MHKCVTGTPAEAGDVEDRWYALHDLRLFRPRGLFDL